MSDTVADLSIDIRSLVKRHGNVLAVDHVSLTVARGEFFSILGPSGAGKSSVLRMLAGFERPDAGEILIDGRSMAGVPPNRRPVNMVFQSYALFPHLSVRRNVAFGLEMRRTPKADIERRVGAILEMTRLVQAQDRLPAQLSGGEQQRVALARALVNRPAVVLLDEPLSALDEQLRQDMQGELKAIQAQVGITFVCVTHHQAEALAMSDRLAVMHRGKILQVGRPEEIYESPVNRFVAQFVGTSNELRGILAESRDGEGVLRPSQPGEPLPIRVPVRQAYERGSEVTFLIRPERLRILPPDAPSTDHNRLAGTIDKKLYAGSRLHYFVRVIDSVLWRVDVANDAESQASLPVGARVSVAWHPSDGSLFQE
jgi:spermidine/putrescine transport system ATP-binding protein